jgi:hypothetical protein
VSGHVVELDHVGPAYICTSFYMYATALYGVFLRGIWWWGPWTCSLVGSGLGTYCKPTGNLACPIKTACVLCAISGFVCVYIGLVTQLSHSQTSPECYRQGQGGAWAGQGMYVVYDSRGFKDRWDSEDTFEGSLLCNTGALVTLVLGFMRLIFCCYMCCGCKCATGLSQHYGAGQFRARYRSFL